MKSLRLIYLNPFVCESKEFALKNGATLPTAALIAVVAIMDTIFQLYYKRVRLINVFIHIYNTICRCILYKYPRFKNNMSATQQSCYIINSTHLAIFGFYIAFVLLLFACWLSSKFTLLEKQTKFSKPTIQDTF